MDPGFHSRVGAGLDPGFDDGFDPELDDGFDHGFADDPDYGGFWDDDVAGVRVAGRATVKGGTARGGTTRPVRRPAGRSGSTRQVRRPAGRSGSTRQVRRVQRPVGRGGKARQVQVRRPAARRPRRGNRTAITVSLVVLLVFVAAGGAVGYRLLRTYVIPPDFSGQGTGTLLVQVADGQSAHDVAQTLARLGVVASPRAFIKAVEADPQAQIDPGTYRLHRQMKASLALQLLLSPAARVQARVAIPEGWRVSQITAALGSRSGIALSNYRAAEANPGSLGLPSYARDHLEGYLFPATYNVQPKMTAAQVLRAMVQQFNQQAAQLGVTSGAKRLNLTPDQLVTVASLVQAEGGRASDFPKISRVIYNRLATGMQLDLDSTVMYALHTYGIVATDQQVADTISPYNTYRHNGLPPGPICNPGSEAIQAALHPASGNWIYFVTVDPKHGITRFTASAAQFQQLRAQLQRNMGK
jgi:UPF0755 protein